MCVQCTYMCTLYVYNVHICVHCMCTMYIYVYIVCVHVHICVHCMCTCTYMCTYMCTMYMYMTCTYMCTLYVYIVCVQCTCTCMCTSATDHWWYSGERVWPGCVILCRRHNLPLPTSSFISSSSSSLTPFLTLSSPPLTPSSLLHQA